jgi:hypothetical protein
LVNPSRLGVEFCNPEALERGADVVQHCEFHIGLEFWCGERRFRCTDIGSRVVTAIRVDGAEIGASENGRVATRFLNCDEAEAQGWFSGPPYAVAEIVFDEYDLEGCSLEEGEPAIT